VPVPPSALGQTQVLEDPWILIPELYEPGYIGGWSALKYRDLTEQLFRSVCVLTRKRVTHGETVHQDSGGFYKASFGKSHAWHQNHLAKNR